LYSKELLLFYILAVLLIFLLSGKNYPAVYLFLLFTISYLIFLNFLGRRSGKGTEEIKKIIEGIRNSNFGTSDEIILRNHFPGLQDEIRLMFEKVKSDIEYLKKLERMRSEFLANVSHELRTPIFSIQGYIETLLNGAIDDEKVNRNFLEKAIQNTLNLNNLLNDLIDISMIETGEMKMSFRYFRVIDFIQEIVDEFKPITEEKKLELEFIPPKNNLQLYGDKNRLHQVLSNLIINAIKYTEKGKIEIIIEEELKYGKIIVRDTGIGIPEEDLNRIFERFYRVDKARARNVGGTGLGLAIAKHIVEAHNSHIEVKSKVNSGTEFSFLLKK
jgi:two-component system phosphate regulon sensor histidine kinase PhoR